MNKIFKMDLHRMLHSKSFYVTIVFLIAMAVGQLIGGMNTTLDGLMGAVSAADGGADFMSSAMGAGVIYILLSIILAIFVCGDYSGGFAKSIFSVHADPKEYIGGKLLSMGVTSAFMLVLYTVICAIALPLFGHAVALTGGIFGLLVFLIEKWLLSIALCAVILLVALFTRNMAWSILAGFLVSTGGLTMGAAMLAEMLHMPWIETAFSFTISSTARLCSMTFEPVMFIRILLTCIGWVAAACAASALTIRKKDI